MTTSNDPILINQILTGDVQAYATLVDIYKDRAVMLAYNILLNREDAEEAAQDAFVKVYASLHTFKATAAFSTWLYRIVLNTALNKKKLKKHYFREVNESLDEELPAELNSALAAQTTTEQRKQIRLAMRALNEKERICITLFYLHELSVEEISELTGFTRSGIKVLLHRGRKNLYESFDKWIGKEIINLM